MDKLTTCLWFNGQAEDAARFYTSIFRNSKVGKISYYGPSGAEVSGNREGSVMTVEFELEGQQFMALNGGPEFTFSEATSFVINCDSQEEIDEFWEKLSEGGEPGPCGWLKDKFGVSWQVVPVALGEMMQDADPEAVERAMKAMLQMHKLDIAALEAAFRQPEA